MEKRSIRVGVNKKSEIQDGRSNFESNWEISLAGLDNKGYILTTVNDVINWSRTGSLYWMTFGLSLLCC